MPTNLRPFIHLRVHSTYSLGVGLSTPAEVCAHAQRAGYSAVALTDINGTYGYVEFHHAARALGIKPIYGTLVVVDWRVGDEVPADERHTLTLLALDRVGLRNVCATAGLSGARRERNESFLVSDLQGAVAGVVCIVGLPSTVSAVLPRSTSTVLSSLRSLFGERLFVETPTSIDPDQAESRAQLDALARRMDISPVLCQDVRFVGPDKAYLVDLIGAGEETAPTASDDTTGAPAHHRSGIHGMYSPAEISALYDANQEAYTNASLVASLVQPDILDAIGASRRTVTSLPMFARQDVRRAFVDLVRTRFQEEFSASPAQEREVWESRLRDEMEVIDGTELEDAFVQFREIAERVRGSGVLLGPSTGLRLQSLCAYLLGITRFNPYRVDPNFRPFFDERDRFNRILDLQVGTGSRRTAVAGVKTQYDEAGIGYVPTVEHITAARALRMIAARLETRPDGFDDMVAVATKHPGATLQELCTQSRRIGQIYKRSAVIRDIVAHAAPLEGLPYGFIRSRRTLIISPTPLRDFLGVVVSPETGDSFVQSTRDAFPVGSISRVDLATLNALETCTRLGVSSRSGAALNWESAVHERDTYRAVQEGELDGVHLLETPLIQPLAGAFGIESFDDLVRFIALMRYKRGGLSLSDRIESFRKDGERHGDGELSHVLRDTNGWMVFDDQLRDVISVVTGLDPQNAAQMARRFAREGPAELASLRREFMTFAVERGTPMDTATASFTRVLHTAGGTVPRQAVIAEALVTATMLYLKAREPVRYFTALVNTHLRNDAKRKAYLERLGEITVLLAPDINDSGVEFKAVKQGVRAPLWAIDGVDFDSARRVAHARGTKKVRGRAGFDLLIAEANISYKTVEALVGAGALESVGIPATEKVRPDSQAAPRATPPEKAAGQIAFELGPTDGGIRPTRTPVSSPHPSELFHTENVGNKRIAFRVLPALAEFYPHPIASAVEMAGRISDLRSFRSGSGEQVAFFMLRDSSTSVPVFVPWERVGQPGEPVADGDRVLVRGFVRIREGKKACEGLEVVAAGGGINHGETTPDESAEGDP